MATIFILTQNEAWENPLKQGVFLTLEGAMAFANENWKGKFKGVEDTPDFQEVKTDRLVDWRITSTRKWESGNCGNLSVDWLEIEEFEVTPKGGK